MARWAVVGLGYDTSSWISNVQADYLRKDRPGNAAAAAGTVSTRQPTPFWRTLSLTLQAQWNYWMFEAALAMMSVAYHIAQFKSLVERKILGKKSDGFESVLDDALKQRLEQEYGIKVEGDLFDA